MCSKRGQMQFRASPWRVHHPVAECEGLDFSIYYGGVRHAVFYYWCLHRRFTESHDNNRSAVSLSKQSQKWTAWTTHR